MCSGREFRVWAAATGKARLPTSFERTANGNNKLIFYTAAHLEETNNY